LFEGIDDEALMRRLEKRRGKGRNDYPVRVMWNLILAMIVFGHNTIASFQRELSRNLQLRRYCGLNDFSRKKHLVPPLRVFSTFFKLLQSEVAEVERIFNSSVWKLNEVLANFGKDLAVLNEMRSIQRRSIILQTSWAASRARENITTVSRCM
jgi:hypothetical protein